MLSWAGLFKRKAVAADPARVGTEPIEVYVDLLDRSGRSKEAIDAALKYLPDTVPSQRVVPQLLETRRALRAFSAAARLLHPS